ncbi:hypothetical protein PGT21_014134 [Puccinia graminis f. sp. tritici]|uniref:Uncharacterized protein n=1 Tax=Puccinia graminis f. sp. tritici TaxID=56615 RepID=A0A5B0NQC9_PUCGR|nr:hypothetical protein PGT21_014134 [Puccinia graminis f. sp. tritici]
MHSRFSTTCTNKSPASNLPHESNPPDRSKSSIQLTIFTATRIKHFISKPLAGKTNSAFNHNSSANLNYNHKPPVTPKLYPSHSHSQSLNSHPSADPLTQKALT